MTAVNDPYERLISTNRPPERKKIELKSNKKKNEPILPDEFLKQKLDDSK